MDDYDQSQYQEVSQVSKRYTGRNSFLNAIGGLLFGLLLLVGGLNTMASVERQSLQTTRSYSEASKALIEVPISPVYQKNNLHVVYLSGEATTDETLTEPLLVVSGQALRLNRKVENYQWMEAQKESPFSEKHSSGPDTRSVTYYYAKGWREGIAKSHAFKHPEGHENPTAELFTSDTFAAKKITLGDFTLPSQLYKDITVSTNMDLSTVDVSNIQKTTQKPLFRSDSEIYIGADPQHPQVGDVRITVTAVLSQVVSVIGQQSGDAIQAYAAHAGEPVLMLVSGHQTPQTMLKNATTNTNEMTWLLLGFTLFLVILGCFLLLLPLNALANTFPGFAMMIPPATFMGTVIIAILIWSMYLGILMLSDMPKLTAGIGGVVLIIIIILCKMYKTKKTVVAVDAVDDAEPTFPIEDDEKYHAPPE